MSTSQPGRCGGRWPAGFTLVELLTSVGIITILLGMLLPTLTGVRRQANVIQCANNLRQLTQAMLSYAMDNKGNFPPSGGVAPADGLV